jgi:Ca2+-binding EF-hand superfamily protein
VEDPELRQAEGAVLSSRVVVIVLLLLAVASGVRAQSATPPAYDPRAAFGETDTNHDGAVDHEEFIVRLTEVFYRADKNKDGKLTAVELQETLVETRPFSNADPNKDGSLTVHEFLRARVEDYEKVDTNGDGLLEIDEVVSAYESKK